METSFFGGLAGFLDPIFDPVLSWHAGYAIVAIALIISVLVTLANKYLGKQGELKQLKDEMKTLRKEAAKYRKSDHKKFMEYQKKILEMSQKQMRYTFKPMLWYFIPLGIVFFWISSHFAFTPYAPNDAVTIEVQTSLDALELIAPESFTIEPAAILNASEGTAVWKISTAETGHYELQFQNLDKEIVATKQLIISHEQRYAPVDRQYEGEITRIRFDATPLKPFGAFDIFGWQPGWLGVYILSSIFGSIFFKKVLNVA